MPMSKNKNNYDSIAWAYDYLSQLIFFNQIKKAQTAFIEEVPDNFKILIIGGGTGYYLEQLLLRTNNTQIVYVEASLQMIKKAKKRISNLDKATQQRVEFICGTENDIPLSYAFDCICTHFFLDLFTQSEMDIIVKVLSKHSKPNAQWHFSDFQNTNSFSQTVLLKAIFLFFKITTNVSSSTLPNYFNSLEKLGWKEIKSCYFYSAMIKSSYFKKAS